MQVIYKIAEKQRKTRAGFMQLMDYISRDSFKTFGVGVSDDKDIASRQYLINKDLYDKNRDGKDRFTYHVMASFGVDVPLEKVIEIVEEFCTENFYDKGFNSFFAVHTDTNNIHCHIIADNVNFNTGNMIHSVTEKQYESMSQKKKEKPETFVYEHQRKLFEDICIKHGLDISIEERYEYMHEQKQKEGRKWLTKEQYRAKKDKDSWTNEIKDRLEEIYKNEDITEDNIKDIATQYGLEVTRHNKDKKYITFALLDEQGKRTNQKLKLVQELNKKKKKSQEEVTKDNVKLAVKLNTLETQEKELKKDSSENVFNYDNFFKVKEKEKEQEEERKREQEKAKREQEEKARLEQEKIKKQREERARAEAEEKARLEREKKEAEAEKERLERIEKAKLEEFYRKQQEEKEKEIARQKALEEELKEKERLEAEARANAEKERLRLEQEERAREQEAKAKREAEEKARLERERQQEAERLRLEQEEKARAEAEKERLRLEQEAKAKKEQEEKERLEKEKKEQEEKARREAEKKVAEVESKEEITNSESVITNSKPLITDSEPIITNSVTDSDYTITNSKQEEQVDLDSLMSKIDSYKLVEKYDLYDTLPAFQVIQEDIIYDSSSGEGDTYLAKSLIIDVKGEEYWDNMNVKDIKQWDNTGLFTIYYTDSMDNFKEYAGYEDYSKSTIKQFLEENTTITEELAKQYMQDSDSKTKDSKDYEVEKKKDREIDFN